MGTGSLVHQRHYASESWSPGRSSADADEVRVGRRQVATRGISARPRVLLTNNVEAAADKTVCSKERYIRNVADAVVWYAGSSLPGRLGIAAVTHRVRAIRRGAVARTAATAHD